jgi:hypothetical protein
VNLAAKLVAEHGEPLQSGDDRIALQGRPPKKLKRSRR